MSKQFDPSLVRQSYRSELVEELRELGSKTFGDVTVLIPKSLGFCWGVDRALSMVQEARSEYVGRPMWLIASIIHNPRVNADLREQGIGFLRGEFSQAGAWDNLCENDVVIVPAFSATVEDMNHLRSRGVTIVDTTCPWVIKPHKRTLKYVKEGFTTVIHGTVGHEETEATCSLILSEGGHYVVVYSIQEAECLSAFIEGEASAEELVGSLRSGSFSPGFDFELHMIRLGVINQTTMLASESRAIGERLRLALVNRDDQASLESNFRDFDTICRATQDNQDAASAVAEQQPDLYLVVGGYDSSNTKNLARVGHRLGVPAFHIEGPHCLGEQLEYRHRTSGEILRRDDWVPSTRPLTVAFSAGASTPDTLLGEVIERLLDSVNN
ncbi:MAG TPA: 4-hydroxy-3-methylbut-2-enyl diphosphate reductase [Planctomycetes bacterium]|jgi:4-hydroxy-3-methylbut-2-enyl diphosphate reductase|nr:4-hydroxy-3-methylbut-2-enyl diphosphate reductase [Planctomycetota bacterium]